jgi:hypothetical protein
VLGSIASGDLKLRIHETYPLEQAAQAHRSEEKTIKVTIDTVTLFVLFSNFFDLVRFVVSCSWSVVSLTTKVVDPRLTNNGPLTTDYDKYKEQSTKHSS